MRMYIEDDETEKVKDNKVVMAVNAAETMYMMKKMNTMSASRFR